MKLGGRGRASQTANSVNEVELGGADAGREDAETTGGWKTGCAQGLEGNDCRWRIIRRNSVESEDEGEVE